MNKDKALEELFLAQKPHFDDGDAFMASLAKRLDAVEYIKQHQEATIRRYKMAMVLAFVAGVLSGGIAIAYILTSPAHVPLITFETNSVFLFWVSENSRLIATAFLSFLMTFGLISIVNNIQEIKALRGSLQGN